MDRQVCNVSVAEWPVAAAEMPEELAQEERIQRLEQAIVWASNWQRRASESETGCFHCALRSAYTSGLLRL
jgi:hypothetical protein